MARNLWKGAISFSLIHVPVALQTATRSEELDLDLLDRRDFSPVGYQRVNKTTGKVVAWDDIVKGYAYKPGEYVVLTDEDFRRANVAATQTIEIQSFVDASAVPVHYFETPYFLEAQPRGEKVYALLRDALARSKKLGLALTVIRTRQYLCALMPVGDVLMLNTLRYGDEILPHAKFAPKSAKGPSGKELTLALRLIEEMSEEWEPSKYRDTYRDDILERVKQKVKKGQTHELTAPGRTPRSAPTADAADLAALLQRSLAGVSSPPGQRRGRRVERRTRRASRSRRRA